MNERNEFKQLVFLKQTNGYGNVQSVSELTRDAFGGFPDKENTTVRVGQLESRMVNALSAQPYHLMFPNSQVHGAYTGRNTLPNAMETR